jgi:hypothetical protein
MLIFYYYFDENGLQSKDQLYSYHIPISNTYRYEFWSATISILISFVTLVITVYLAPII